MKVFHFSHEICIKNDKNVVVLPQFASCISLMWMPAPPRISAAIVTIDNHYYFKFSSLRSASFERARICVLGADPNKNWALGMRLQILKERHISLGCSSSSLIIILITYYKRINLTCK